MPQKHTVHDVDLPFFFLSSGGAELLFDGVKEHHVTLPSQSEPCEYHLSGHAISRASLYRSDVLDNLSGVFYCSFSPVPSIHVVRLPCDDNIKLTKLKPVVRSVWWITYRVSCTLVKMYWNEWKPVAFKSFQEDQRISKYLKTLGEWCFFFRS